MEKRRGRIRLSNSHFEERGCVGDQPQRADRPEPLGFLHVLRRVEDDTAALRFKMRIAEFVFLVLYTPGAGD